VGEKLMKSFRQQAAATALAFSLGLALPLAGGQGPPTVPLPTRGGRTNLPAIPRLSPTNAPGLSRSASKTNATVGSAKSGPTNAVAAKAPAVKGGTGTQGRVLEYWQRLRKSESFYAVMASVGAGCLALVLAIRLLLRRTRKAGQGAAAPAGPAWSGKAGKQPKRIHACNVLLAGADTRQLWQFDARNGGVHLNRALTSLPGESLPGVRKDWSQVWSQRLNIAWLPPEHVFLRVAQFPRADFAETASMVELQLEKLSPLPVTQIVWTLQIVPHASGDMQTVILVIVSRNIVEEFLGKLEGQGFLADRLEVSLLDQLQATAITEDGAWIYPEGMGGQNQALVAWWYGGVLQNLDIITFPAANRAESLKEQVLQMAWAGEMEGWLTAPPSWHLVADETVAAEWEPALRVGLEQPVELVEPLRAPDLAARTAARATRSDAGGGLLPSEFSTRYHQQFVDRLWMGVLGSVVVLYLAGVLVYFVALSFLNYKTRGVEKQVAGLGQIYTNAMQLKAQCQVLKDRQELKFAALDCWNVTAKIIPEGVTLESLNFSDGKRLVLSGTAGSDLLSQLIEFESKMRKENINGQPFFDPTKGDNLHYTSAGGGVYRWDFALELRREAQ
jgi:hypothetical protein